MDRAKASTHGFIIQKYLEAPLLYHGRKFDLRVWAVCASDAGSQIGMRVYAFREGYARTSSEQFALPTADGRDARGAPAGDGETCRAVQEAVRHEQMVHLTNYCMQVQSAHCGTHEEGNCASFDDLSHAAPHVDFRGAVLPAIYALVADSLLASRRELLTGLREHGGGRRCAANARSLARRLFGCSAVSSHCCCCLPACFTPLVSPLHTSRPHPFLAPSSPLVHTPSSPLPPLSHAWPPGCVRSSASISCLRRVGGPS